MLLFPIEEGLAQDGTLQTIIKPKILDELGLISLRVYKVVLFILSEFFLKKYCHLLFAVHTRNIGYI